MTPVRISRARLFLGCGGSIGAPRARRASFFYQSVPTRACFCPPPPSPPRARILNTKGACRACAGQTFPRVLSRCDLCFLFFGFPRVWVSSPSLRWCHFRSQGSMRLAFPLLDLSNAKGSQRCVAKLFKDMDVGMDVYFREVEMQFRCSQLAQVFPEPRLRCRCPIL